MLGSNPRAGSKIFGSWESLVIRLLGVQENAGPNPADPTNVPVRDGWSKPPYKRGSGLFAQATCSVVSVIADLLWGAPSFVMRPARFESWDRLQSSAADLQDVRRVLRWKNMTSLGLISIISSLSKSRTVLWVATAYWCAASAASAGL